MVSVITYLILVCLCINGQVSTALRAGPRKMSQYMFEQHSAKYYPERKLFTNYGQPIGALQNAVAELLKSGEELAASAEDAVELAKAKVGLTQTENLSPKEKLELDQREQRLTNKINTMADSVVPKLQSAVDGLQSIISGRLLNIKHSGQKANRSLQRKMSDSSKHADEYTPRHYAEVKMGEPDNDLTSSALYDPNNTVFSRHPEFLRHNTHTETSNSPVYKEIIAESEDDPIINSDKLKADFEKFSNELLQYIKTNASQFYFTGSPNKDTKQNKIKMAHLVQKLQDVHKRSSHAVIRLTQFVAGQYN